jgi:hypothetical protein
MNDADLTSRIAADLNVCQYTYTTEDTLQAGVVQALRRAGRPAVREVALSPGERVDVLTGDLDVTLGGQLVMVRTGIVVECKLRGGAISVLGQLARYAAYDGVDGVVLVTARPEHAREMPATVAGVPLRIVVAVRGYL